MYKAKLSYFRVSARKGRLVADLIRGRKVIEAQNILKFTPNKTAEPMLKLLNSAAANANTIDGLKPENLYISKVLVDEGPTYKRMMPRARGSGDRIRKRTAHIEIELAKNIEEVKTEKKAEETTTTKKVVKKAKTEKKAEDKKVKKTKKNES